MQEGVCASVYRPENVPRVRFMEVIAYAPVGKATVIASARRKAEVLAVVLLRRQLLPEKGSLQGSYVICSPNSLEGTLI